MLIGFTVVLNLSMTHYEGLKSIICSHVWRVFMSVWSFNTLLGSCISWYNIQTCYMNQTSAVVLSRRSLMYNRKSSGLTTIHWGTPDTTLAGADFLASMMIVWGQCITNEWFRSVCWYDSGTAFLWNPWGFADVKYGCVYI